jgi:hypothetical protein
MHGGIEVRTMSLLLRLVRRSPKVGIAYTAMLLGGYLWWVLQPAGQRMAVLANSSTDLAHLERVPWLVLPASSIWSGDNIGWWLAATLLCLCALEVAHGSVAVAVTGFVAHVVGTLVSEGLIAARIAAGELSSSAGHVLDVGPSYIVASCAAAVVASPRTPRSLRILCALTFVPLYVAAFDFSDAGQVATLGHAVAIAVGALMARTKLFRGTHHFQWPHLGDVVDSRVAVSQR